MRSFLQTEKECDKEGFILRFEIIASHCKPQKSPLGVSTHVSEAAFFLDAAFMRQELLVFGHVIHRIKATRGNE